MHWDSFFNDNQFINGFGVPVASQPGTLKNSPKIILNIVSWRPLMTGAGSSKQTHTTHRFYSSPILPIPSSLGARKILCCQFSTFCAINKASKAISPASHQQMASAVVQGRFSLGLGLVPLSLLCLLCLKCSVL